MKNQKAQKIAVVIPVYNVELYLSECLESLRAQDCSEFLAIVVDDGSNDASKSIIERIASIDKRFIPVYKNNGGVATARNAALQIIEKRDDIVGVCFVDSDDICEKNFISSFLKLSQQYSADYVVTGYQKIDKNSLRKFDDCNTVTVIDRNGAFRQALNLGEWKQKKTKTTSGFLMNRYFSLNLIRGLRFNEKLHRAEDTDFMWRAINRVSSGVVSESSTYFYRIRKSSLSHREDMEMDIMKFHFQILSVLDDFPEFVKEKLERQKVKSWWRTVCAAVRNNQFSVQKEELESYREILQEDATSMKFSLKEKIQIFSFSLGEHFLRFLLGFRRKQKDKNIEMENAFD